MKLASIRSVVSALILSAATAAPAQAQLPWQPVATPVDPYRLWAPLVPPPLRHGAAAQMLERLRIDLWRVRRHLFAMRALAVEASNGLLTQADRALLNAQFQARIQRISAIAATSRVGDLQLMNGTHVYLLLQIRPARFALRQLWLPDATPMNLGIVSSHISTAASAMSVVADCDMAISNLYGALLQRRAAVHALGL